MNGWLHGQVLHHHKDGAVVLDVHDVGYEVSVASQEDYRVGDVVDLYIFTAVRDDVTCQLLDVDLVTTHWRLNSCNA